MEQRVQSQACLSYAESRRRKAKPTDDKPRASQACLSYAESRRRKAKPTDDKPRASQACLSYAESRRRKAKPTDDKPRASQATPSREQYQTCLNIAEARRRKAKPIYSDFSERKKLRCNTHVIHDRPFLFSFILRRLSGWLPLPILRYVLHGSPCVSMPPLTTFSVYILPHHIYVI